MCWPGHQPEGARPGRRAAVSRRPRPAQALSRPVRTLVALLVLLVPSASPLVRHAAWAQGGIGFSPATLDFGELGTGGEGLATLSLDSSFEDVTVLDLSIVGADASWFSVHANEPAALADEAPIDEIAVVPEVARRIVVRVRIPADAPPGTRLAGLRLEQRSTGETNDIDVGVEVPLSVTVQGAAVLAGEVVGVELPAVELGAPIEVRARIRNTGSTVLPVDAEISAVIDGIAGTGQRFRTETVAPGAEKILVYTLDTVPPAGTHGVEAVFRTGADVLGTVVTEVVVGRSATTTTTGGSPLSGQRDNGGVIWPVFAFGLLAVIAALVLAERSGRPEAAHASSTRLRGGTPRQGRHQAEPGSDGWSPGPTSRPDRWPPVS